MYVGLADMSAWLVCRPDWLVGMDGMLVRLVRRLALNVSISCMSALLVCRPCLYVGLAGMSVARQFSCSM